MNIKPILIVTGEPFSIFSEILCKAIKKGKFKRPLVLIGSFELLNKQIKFFNSKLSLNIIDKNFNYKYLKKN